jgi:hypothetical protein
MSNSPGKERRKYPRTDVSMEVNYHVLGVIDDLASACTKDSSLAGFLLKTDHQIKHGVCLVLEIPWPSRLTPIRLLGRVVESVASKDPKIYDTRIEFLAMNDETRKLVEKLTQHYLQ